MLIIIRKRNLLLGTFFFFFFSQQLLHSHAVNIRFKVTIPVCETFRVTTVDMREQTVNPHLNFPI